MSGTRALLVVVSAPILILVLQHSSAIGTIRMVPTNFPMIQQAIQASSAGDTVLVLPGTYLENILISQDVVVRSAQGPAVTLIDGGDPLDPDSASVVIISSGTLEGFGIANGAGTNDQFAQGRTGGGVLAVGSGSQGPLIRGNWIHHNTLSGRLAQGGGIRVSGFARILSNRIYTNRVEGSNDMSGGGAISVARRDPLDNSTLIEDNEIYDNHTAPPGQWGAIYGDRSTIRHSVIACNSGYFISGISDGGCTIEGNTLVANWSTAEPPGPVIWLWASGETVSSAAIANNVTDNQGIGLYCNQYGPPPHLTNVVECNNLMGNGGPSGGICANIVGHDGNIAVDPLYGQGSCELVRDDWCLQPESPLLPEHSPPGCGLIGAVGECSPISVADSETPSGRGLHVLPPRPNPFLDRTTIGFFLSKPGPVEVSIYGMLGRKVRTLEAGSLAAGDHEIEWDGRRDDGEPAASGAYVAVIRAGGREVTRVLLLVR